MVLRQKHGRNDDAEEPSQERSDSFEEIDYGREFQDYLDPGYRTGIEQQEDAPVSNNSFHFPSLIEHFEWQLNMLDIDDELEIAAKSIIGNLDDDGRLATIEEIAASSLTVECVESANLVMGLDPVGCGALDVKCLLALEANEDGDSLAARLVRDHFEDFVHRLQHCKGYGDRCTFLMKR
jgi:RNA polymerase sigma-54 factor